MQFLKANTVTTITLGPFLTSTRTAVTNVEVSSATIIDFYKGATRSDVTTRTTGSNAMAHLANGYYSLGLLASNLNTAGPFTVTVNVDPVEPFCQWYDVGAIADLVWDEVLTAATHNVASSAGRRLRQLQVGGNYEDGAIWIDTVNGVSGTTVDENGTVTNPVSSLTDALTISASNNLKKIHYYPGSSETLAASLEGYVILGVDTEIALAGQSISGSVFNDCELSGEGTGTSVEMYNCDIGTCELPPGTYTECRFSATLTIGSAGDYELIDCCSVVAGASTPYIDFDAAIGTTTMSIRRWSGGLNMSNLGAGDVVSVEGTGGTITVNGTAGTVHVRGIFNAVTDSSSGAVTVVTNAHLNKASVNAEVVDALATDTYAEASQGIPSATTTLKDKIGYIYKFLRNKITTTSTLTSVYSDDGGTVDHKSTISDDGTTFTRGEFGSGA